LPYALGVSSDLKVFLGTPRLESPPPLIGTGRPRTRRLLPSDIQAVEPRVARPLLCGQGDARPRLAGASARARSLAAVRTRLGCHAQDQVLPGGPSVPRVAARRGASRASALGDRAAIPGTQRRNRARPLRRPQPAGVATARRLAGYRLQLFRNR